MASHTHWKNIRLGDVAKVISGFAFKSKDFQQEGIPIIKIKNIRVGAVDLSEVDYVDSSFLSLDSKYHVKGGDILISLTGSHLTQPNSVVGRVALQSLSLGHCLLNQRAGKIILTKPDICHKLFLFYSIYTEEKRREIALMALGAASQANVSPSQVESVEIKLPPLPIQRKIAAILSAYDRLIENNTRRIEILEEMARSIYREWFVKFRFPGHEQAQMVDSELGLIPEGWEVKKFGEVSLNFDNKRKPLSSLQRAKISGKYPYYGAAKIFDYINNYIFEGRYLLVAEDGSVITKDRRPVLQLVDEKFWVNNHTHVIQGKEPISTNYLYLFMSDLDISGYITGAAQPKINQTNLNRIPIIVPRQIVLKQFNAIIDSLLIQVKNLKLKNDNLRKTRDLLLPRLISGEIDVENLDIKTGEIAA